MTPPTRKAGSGTPCPDHGIYCHKSGTYRYADERRNLIVDPDFFMEHLRRHRAKYESHRFGHENSEDAVTWNVLRSFQAVGLLNEVASLATGRTVVDEPELYLWGIRIERNSVSQQPEAGLVAARMRFESRLPVTRPLTEPDIMLYQPGEFLVLIEAKFTSANGVYVRGPRKKAGDLTWDELLSIYHGPELRLLDYELARGRDRVAYHSGGTSHTPTGSRDRTGAGPSRTTQTSSARDTSRRRPTSSTRYSAPRSATAFGG